MSDALATLAPLHLIGAGGAGMSALATVMLERGLAVSGSDAKPSLALDALAQRGARVVVGHDGANLSDAATVVVSTAIRDDNPELVAARAAGLPVLHRAQVLGMMMRERRGVAVTGTHGKTTTTSMIATIATRTGLDPTFMIGGEIDSRGTSARSGAGGWLIAEADESDASFLWLTPEIAVVTNLELEHLETYRDEEHLRATFAGFLGCVRDGGTVVLCADDAGASRLDATPHAVVTYGLGRGDVNGTRAVDGDGQLLSVSVGGAAAGEVRLGVPGEHNARNALGAWAAARAMGLDDAAIAEALATFIGVRRRFQVLGSAAGVVVVDEYAHHPTEVAAALATARERASGKVIAVFQPHLYSRTAAFAPAFAAALDAADVAFILDVYGAREDPVEGVTGELIVAAMRSDARSIPDGADVPDLVADVAGPGDLVLTIGAGDVTALGPMILRALEDR